MRKVSSYFLTSAPILKVVDPKKYFVVCTDACVEGLGGVLMWDNHVACYESRKLEEHEKKYSTHELELVVVLHALRMWRHYLLVNRFELRTNHLSFKYLFDRPNLNVRQ